MSVTIFGSDVYTTFGPIFYDLVGLYELNFDRDPNIDYEKAFESSDILPVYGRSHIPKYVMYLSQLPIVDRLTQIKQLAHTFILFPGATHSRYEHSRGVMHRCTELIKKVNELLNQKCRDKGVSITDDDKVVLNIAALLHDLGHPAWGHALDGITGYVVSFLRKEEPYPLFPPSKLDVTLTYYLLTTNNQMKKALKVCSSEIKDSTLRKLFKETIAQIIMEEEYPLSLELKKNDLLRKIHLLTTVIGKYRGRKNGIDADRLDWVIRDALHANLEEKLPENIVPKFKIYLKRNKENDFDIDIDDCEFLCIDQKFTKLMDQLREEIYTVIYEGLERSFIDSLLIRLAYSAIMVVEKVGNQIASATITTRAVMGYLLLYDHLMKEYTIKILRLAKQHRRLFPSEPVMDFICRSNDLVDILVYHIKHIMHSLSSQTFLQTKHIPKIDLNMKYLDLGLIEKSLIILTADTFGHLIKRAYENLKKTDNVSELAALYQDLVVAPRINPIHTLRVPAAESMIQRKFKDLDVFLLVNYYFFRKMDDNFKDITSLKMLNEILMKKMRLTPVMFVITSKTSMDKMIGIFEIVCSHLLQTIMNALSPLALS